MKKQKPQQERWMVAIQGLDHDTQVTMDTQQILYDYEELQLWVAGYTGLGLAWLLDYALDCLIGHQLMT